VLYRNGGIFMIRELVIISGKGGTGKTSVAASFAALAKNAVIADCDVDAADLHLVLAPEKKSSADFEGGKKAFVDPGLCTDCGECVSYCRFDAIGDGFIVDQLACEGCGVCAHFCPAGAIEMRDHVSGKWFISATPFGTMVHARLGIAEGNSGKLVTLIKKKAREIAESESRGIIIVDGSPGTGCPVIATLSGAYFVLIVTEPTVSGLHDLERVFSLARRFRAKTAVCVNKADINAEMTGRIRDYCAEKGAVFCEEIPYDDDVVAAIVARRPLVEHSRGPAARGVEGIWRRISNEL
jgi:MinD superfamily P-loop ATPase